MKKESRKILSTILTLALALIFVLGAFGTAEMFSGKPIIASVLGSDGDYIPPSPTPTPTPAEKKANPITAKGKTIELSAASLAKNSKTIARKSAITVNNAKGTVTYTKKSGNSKITINKSTGKITVKKGLKKGTYKLKVNVKAAGNSSYKPKTVAVTVTIKVVTAKNPITVKGNTVSFTTDDLAAGDKIIARSEALTINKAMGTLAFAKNIGSEGISVDPSTGDITVAGGLEAGTYKIEIKVKASGNSNYKSGSRSAIVTIKVIDPSASDDDSDKVSDSELFAKLTAKGATGLTLVWNSVDGAEGYDIFFTHCGKTAKYKLVKSVDGSMRSWTKTGLKKMKSYKAYVRAWKMVDGSKSYIKTSPPVHAFTSGGTKLYTNPKSITINRAEILLKQGGTFTIKATVKKLQASKILIMPSHVARKRYISSDKSVATVSKTGKITAVGKGTCRVYAIGANGVRKAILVTVLD